MNVYFAIIYCYFHDCNRLQIKWLLVLTNFHCGQTDDEFIIIDSSSDIASYEAK